MKLKTAKTRSWLTGLLAVAICASTLLSHPQARAQEWPGFLDSRITVPTIDDPATPEPEEPVELAVRVVLPEDSGRYAALLYMTPYSAAHQGAREQRSKVLMSAGARWFTGRTQPVRPAVYAHVTVDVRGTGASGGAYCLLCLQEQQDLWHIIEWISKQPWNDGSVGAIGASYAGISAMFAASQRHPALKAAVPQLVHSDLYREVSSHNGMVNAPAAAQWSASQDAASSGGMIDDSPGSQPRSALGLVNERTLPRAGSCASLGTNQNSCLPVLDVMSRPFDGDWYRERSLYPVASKIDVPVLLQGGWFDFFSRGTVTNFNQISSEEKMLFMAPWGHWKELQVYSVNNPHANNFRQIAAIYHGVQDWWLDLKIYGVDNRTLYGVPSNLDLTRKVHFYDAGTGDLVSTDSFPGSDAELQRFYLSGAASGTETSLSDGSLVKEPHTESSASSTFLYAPTYGASETFGMWGTLGYTPHVWLDQRPDETQALTFTTPALEEDVGLRGPMELRFFGHTTAQDTDWVVKVSDVLPEASCEAPQAVEHDGAGCSRLITRGYLRASHYEVDPARSTDGAPYVINARALPVKDRLIEYRIDIWPTAWTVRAGHRLRVTIASSDVPNHPASPYPGVNTIFHDSKRPAELIYMAHRAHRTVRPPWTAIQEARRSGDRTEQEAAPHKGADAGRMS